MVIITFGFLLRGGGFPEEKFAKLEALPKYFPDNSKWNWEGKSSEKKRENFIKLGELGNNKFWLLLLEVVGGQPLEAFGVEFQVYLCTGVSFWEGPSKESFC